MKKMFSIMSSLETHYNFKIDFQIYDEHAWDKWWIDGSKHLKDNQLQAWNSRVEYPSR